MYSLIKDSSLILRLSDNAIIPQDPNNSDYQTYIKWRDGWTEHVTDFETGNVIDTIEHPPHEPLPADDIKEIVPSVISMSQARLALLKIEFLDKVDAAIGSLSREAKIEWEYSTQVHRDHALVQQFVKSEMFTDAQLDDLFKLASTL